MNVSRDLKNMALDTMVLNTPIHWSDLISVITCGHDKKALPMASLPNAFFWSVFFGLGEWKNRKVACSFKPPKCLHRTSRYPKHKDPSARYFGKDICSSWDYIIYQIGIFSIIKGQF